MGDQRPDDHSTPGALPHDAPCSTCRHDHSALLCDWCPCGLALRNGIDF